MQAEILVVGGGLGGVAAALGALRAGRRVVLTEEYDWLGGQLTSQAVPPAPGGELRLPAAPELDLVGDRLEPVRDLDVRGQPAAHLLREQPLFRRECQVHQLILAPGASRRAGESRRAGQARGVGLASRPARGPRLVMRPERAEARTKTASRGRLSLTFPAEPSDDDPGNSLQTNAGVRRPCMVDHPEFPLLVAAPGRGDIE